MSLQHSLEGIVVVIIMFQQELVQSRVGLDDGRETMRVKRSVKNAMMEGQEKFIMRQFDWA